MTYIQSIVNDKLEAFEAEIQESEMSIIGD
jgi:hypothetical protein